MTQDESTIAMNAEPSVNVFATRRFSASPDRMKKITFAGFVAALLCEAGVIQAAFDDTRGNLIQLYRPLLRTAFSAAAESKLAA